MTTELTLEEQRDALFRSQAKRHAHILNEIVQERIAQDAKWGIVSGQAQTLDRRQLILDEEVGEIARAILEDDIPNMRTELIQVAAVAVATVEAYDRGEWTA